MNAIANVTNTHTHTMGEKTTGVYVTVPQTHMADRQWEEERKCVRRKPGRS